MDPFLVVWPLIAFCLGMVAGKEITDRRWVRNASQIQRLSCGGNSLYKVEDVSPWKKSL